MKKGAVFDVDGVLLDYSYRYHKTYEDVLKKYGLSCPSRKDIMILRRGGNSQREMLDNFLVPKDFPNRTPVIEACLLERARIIEHPKYLALDRTFKNSFETVAEIRKRGYFTAAITRRQSGANFLKQMNKYLRFFDYFSVNALSKEKPIRGFISLFSLGLCYFTTDSVNDVIDGKKAGARVIGVLTGVDNENSLNKAGASKIIKNLGEMMELL